jgi:hypothetical protein
MYQWLFFSSLLLVVWLILFIWQKSARKEMLKTSLLTMLLGFSEPLFVPEYWLPRSLFNLAARTGFDLESFIFSFALGGIAVILYEVITKVEHRKIPKQQISAKRIWWHRVLIFLSPAVFVALLLGTSINPIYPTIIGLLLGGITTLFCRPDLWQKVLVGGLLFFAFYFVFFLAMVLFYPHFVEETWNMTQLSGILVLGVPLEELVFGFAVGLMWSAIYEHLLWLRIRKK